LSIHRRRTAAALTPSWPPPDQILADRVGSVAADLVATEDHQITLPPRSTAAATEQIG
jgi:hypothetical protein